MALRLIASRKWRLGGLFALGTLLLAGNFGLNLFSFANSVWFQLHQRDSESLVVARLVESREHGPATYRAMLGQFTNSTMSSKRELVDTQYRLYTEPSRGLSNYTYRIYLHQVGGQAPVLGALDRAVNGALDLAIQARLARPRFFEKVNENKIVLLQLAVAAINATVVALLILWFAVEFGEGVGWSLLLLTLLSPWLTVFGRNLYWMMGTWFLPLVISAWLCRWYDQGSRSLFTSLALLLTLALGTAIGVFAKSTMGYEYLSTITLAQFTVVLYYAVKWGWGWFRTLVWLGAGGVGSVAGFVGALHVHLRQLTAFYGGSEEKGLIRLKELISSRTAGDVAKLQAEFGAKTSGNPLLIVFKYVFSIWNLFPPYILFLAPFVWIAWRILRGAEKGATELRPLAWATLFSFSAPLSWFIVARGHSFVHFHLNYVLWHLPTMFFGGALVVAWLRGRYRVHLTVSRA